MSGVDGLDRVLAAIFTAVFALVVSLVLLFIVGLTGVFPSHGDSMSIPGLVVFFVWLPVWALMTAGVWRVL